MVQILIYLISSILIIASLCLLYIGSYKNRYGVVPPFLLLHSKNYNDIMTPRKLNQAIQNNKNKEKEKQEKILKYFIIWFSNEVENKITKYHLCSTTIQFNLKEIPTEFLDEGLIFKDNIIEYLHSKGWGYNIIPNGKWRTKIEMVPIKTMTSNKANKEKAND